MLGRRAWFNVPPADILPRSRGDIAYVDGRKLEASPLRMKFFTDHASYPFRSHELWFLVEDMRWGVLPGDTDTKALIAAVNREDIWRSAAKLAGVAASDIPASPRADRKPSLTARCSTPPTRPPISPASPSSAPDRVRTI